LGCLIGALEVMDVCEIDGVYCFFKNHRRNPLLCTRIIDNHNTPQVTKKKRDPKEKNESWELRLTD